jgi:DNA repair photolyase
MYITDCGDPVFCPERVIQALNSDEPGILITKNPGKLFDIIKSANKHNNVIVQVTYTGLGGTVYEPLVPNPSEFLPGIQRLVNMLGQDKVFARYDPIIPGVNDSEENITTALVILEKCSIKGVTASVVDMYPKAVKRFKERNLPLPFEGFHCPDRKIILQRFIDIAKRFEMEVRICCEEGFSCGNCGCDWPDKLVDVSSLPKGNQREHCSCPKYRQLIQYGTCKHGCVYCYA